MLFKYLFNQLDKILIFVFLFCISTKIYQQLVYLNNLWFYLFNLLLYAFGLIIVIMQMLKLPYFKLTLIQLILNEILIANCTFQLFFYLFFLGFWAKYVCITILNVSGFLKSICLLVNMIFHIEYFVKTCLLTISLSLSPLHPFD